jgi:hypothetical protein
VDMRLDGPPPALARVPGVSDVVLLDGHLRCKLEGDVRPFLAALEGSHVIDLTIEPARLEDAFLELYADAADGLDTSNAADEADLAEATDGTDTPHPADGADLAEAADGTDTPADEASGPADGGRGPGPGEVER